MRKRNIGRILAVAMLLGIVGAGAYFYQWRVPRSWIGVRFFQWKYEHAANRADFLREYHEHLREVCGGHLPENADEWLVERFTSEPGERAHIVGFYSRQAGIGWRENDKFIRLGSEFAAEVVKALPTYRENVQIRGGMILLEDLRRGRVMYKARLEDEPDSLGRAIKLYQKWWEENLEWDVKRSKDPLDGSGLMWYEL